MEWVVSEQRLPTRCSHCGIPSIKRWVILIIFQKNAAKICLHQDFVVPLHPRAPGTLPVRSVQHAGTYFFIMRITQMPTVTNSLYPNLCAIAYWLNVIKPDNSFMQDLKALLVKYPNVDPAAMGFSRNWRSEPLWQ